MSHIPLTHDQVRAILKIFRDLLKLEDHMQICNSVQQYLALEGLEAPSYFIKQAKKLSLLSRGNVAESLSLGQTDSKIWLISEIEKLKLPHAAHVYVLGGWNGILPFILLATSAQNRYQVTSVDIDPEATKCAAKLLEYFILETRSFDTTTADMLDLEYPDVSYLSHASGQMTSHRADLIINTSCEHLSNFNGWWNKIPAGTLLALQSNDFFAHPTHVNCSANLEDFALKTPLQETIYSGELPGEQYTRFMRIGCK